MRNTTTGDTGNNNFAALLDKFDSDPSAEADKKLIEEAKTKEPLTSRQREAVIARCNNRINGTYGKSKEGVVFKGA